MERVDVGDNSPLVFIDYAHTPQAIDVALGALRAHYKGMLWCVFGCGGDRDAGKRPQMGRIAERRADRVVVTSDNPRGEDPLVIINQVVDGIANPERATIIEDRATAIAYAISEAAPEDIILVAGKGHENYQQLGDKRIDFSDYGVAVASLTRRAEGRS
jgi:UDP-N-acetylmuramoyl-L-alanyl-D-glutamate--2,6-diaminopimelate ligase